MTNIEFIETIGALAKEDMAKSGVLASLTTAQAILESNYGKSSLSSVGKALFGIKAGSKWKGKIYNAKTKECYDGQTFVITTANFRAYDSWAESIADHSSFLTSLSRYKKVVGEKDYKKACNEIQTAGYATDPNYAQKLISIIEKYNLSRFDISNTDSTPDSWASDAIQWAKSLGILRGDDKGDLRLNSNCTRQEVLVFIDRMKEVL